MKLRLRDAALFSSTAPARLPFRFGATTLTRGATLVARVRIESEASPLAVEGFSADLLVPKWFEKDPAKSAEDDAAALVASARAAASEYVAPAAAATAFDHATRVAAALVESRPEGAPDRLVRGFGAALLERAVIDAACRAAGLSFFAALREGALGFEPARIYPELAGMRPEDFLPAAPLESIAVRHTVGLADALRERDVPAASRVGDGFPESLEAEVRARSLSWFKVKLAGDPPADAARLLAVASVLDETAPSDWRLTVDGNEQFASCGAVEALLDALLASEAGRRLLARLVHVEQPLPRARTLDPAHAPSAALAARVALVIDEADSGAGAFPRAARLGYRGVSAKNCKGVFRSLAHAALVVARRDASLFQSAEDLTTLPVLALQQDLATAAAIGLAHAERNGHHYFRGLAHLPPEEARGALAAHADLYEEAASCGGALRIRGGRLAIASLQGTGFGYGVPIRVDARTPVAEPAAARPLR